jgi:hypothetical protein
VVRLPATMSRALAAYEGSRWTTCDGSNDSAKSATANLCNADHDPLDRRQGSCSRMTMHPVSEISSALGTSPLSLGQFNILQLLCISRR